MNNQELLQIIQHKLQSGELSRGEVERVLGSDSVGTGSVGEVVKLTKHFSVTQILYALGGLVVLLGIIFFVAQVWDAIGSAGRIIVTFVLGLIFAGLGSYLYKAKAESWLGHVFHGIAGFLIPGGALVTLSELSQGIVSPWPVAITIGVIFLFYLLLVLYHKTVVLTFFATANGTAFTYLLVESILSGPVYQHGDVYAYLTMVVGISYVLLSYGFRGTWNRHLVGLLNLLGSAGFLAAGYSQVFDSVPWQFIYFVLAVGGLALAVYSKSRAILVASTFFLIAHFIFITQEYFADSIGWPLSLVLLGFVLIGLGYVSITINKRYLKKSE